MIISKSPIAPGYALDLERRVGPAVSVLPCKVEMPDSVGTIINVEIDGMPLIPKTRQRPRLVNQWPVILEVYNVVRCLGQHITQPPGKLVPGIMFQIKLNAFRC